MLPPKIMNKAKMSILTTFIEHCTEVLDQLGKKMKQKDIQIEKIKK